MSNITIALSILIGSLLFLFLFWRRLKEDYPADQIFSFGFVVIGFMLLGFAVGKFVSFKYLDSAIFNSNGLWFWTMLVFGSLSFAIFYIRFRFRFFEAMEAAGLGFISIFFVISLVNAVLGKDIRLFLYSLVQALIIFIFFFLDSRYKSFTWYKSGKVGFAGLSVLAIFFLTRSMLALIDPVMLSFIGKFDAIISSVVSFGFFLTLFNLSGA